MRKLKLHYAILLGMLVGAAAGTLLSYLAGRGLVADAWVERTGDLGQRVGQLFLRLLQMLVVPLIASSLVTAVSGMGDLRRVGRLGGRALAYYAGTSLLAITTGILVVHGLRPGRDADLPALQDQPVEPGLTEPASVSALLWEQLLRLIPDNPVRAGAEGDMLGIIFFSLLFGLFISAAGGETAALLTRIARAVFEVMMRMTLFVIHLAPIGVFGFMLHATATQGLGVFVPLAKYMFAVALALAVHALLTLPALLWLLTRRNPKTFAQALSPALLTAFATASSNATLPLTMRCVEARAHIHPRVVAFVLPLGATINMDGTALYEVVAVLFIAQVLGVELSLAQQFIVALTALLASVGAAGIPHAGTVMMVIVLGAVGLPVTAVGLLLAVDRVLDMGRTAVNVWSDATAAALIAHYDVGHEEGSADPSA